MFTTLFDKLSHLPVTSIATTVAEYFTSSLVPVVTSDVASGKTMLIPAHCALMLQDDPVDKVVYVLEPTRFLANNAAESLRLILGPNEENLIGCINSNRSDDDSLTHPDNRIIFTTVGYALSSGILMNRNNFILDEAHETSIDLSLTKAYLHHRRNRGDLINIAELSATIDISNEMDYWGEDAAHFTTDGSAFPVEYLHRPAFSLQESVLTLIDDHARKGILVFVSGAEEIEEAVQAITIACMKEEIDAEVYSIYGGSTGAERKAASRPRIKAVKILVGTNVLESGVSLPWVDAGVSSGDTKIMHVQGNVRKLMKEELPRWRIKQQIGRCGRFEPGVFILADLKPLEERPEKNLPDIVRLPLTELIMHCTAYPDIHIHDLVFTKDEQPKPEAIQTAIDTLVQYGLIEEGKQGQLILTNEGLTVRQLPLNYRSAVAFCEAVRLDMASEMLPLVAMLDMGDLRHIYRMPMFGSTQVLSDPIYQLRVITEHFYNWKSKNKRELDHLFETFNISAKRFHEFTALIKDLERKTGMRADFGPYFPDVTGDDWDKFELQAKQVIFRSMILETYPYNSIYKAVRIPVTQHGAMPFSTATITNTSNVELSFKYDVLMCSGNVRVITPKNGMPFAVLESITAFTQPDVVHLIKRFGKPALQRIANLSNISTSLGNFLAGPQPVKPSRAAMQYSYAYDDPYEEQPPEPTAVIEKEPAMGTLGSILTQALQGR